jgi:hypothetical protein
VESRQIEVSEISRGVKSMARELQIPVICLSQLNRAAEQREGHRPRMSDLRESGSIEQDADVVMLLHREDYYYKDDQEWAENNPDKLGVAELILTKQRNGPTGTIKLSWIAQSTRFRDFAAPYTGPPQDWVDREPKVLPEVQFSQKGPASRAGSVAGSGALPAPSSGGSFTRTRKTGPIENFRDGGGPEADDQDNDISDIPI